MPKSSTHYIIPGTKFYRLGSRKIFQTYGENLQNKTKFIRSIYIPPAGKKFIQRDQSGAEALIVAYLCRAGRFRELFENNIKPHVFVALNLFHQQFQQKLDTGGLDIKCDLVELCGLSIPELKKNPFWKQVDSLIRSSDNWNPSERYYYIAKQVCHSSNYGITENMFCLNTLEKSQGKVVISKKDAQKFLSFYHALFPEIREWHRLIENAVRKGRLLYNLLGFPIQFTGDLSTDSSMKEAFSSIPQSTVACINRQAFYRTQEFIEMTGKDWDLRVDNHDSILASVPIEDEIEYCKASADFVEIELTAPRGEKFRMRSEVQSGFNWGQYHPEKNPDGLRDVNYQL